jgi:hypothetical protein
MPTNTKTRFVLFTVINVATTLASASQAHAQSAGAIAPDDVLKAAPASPAARGAASDPNIDRGFLAPTAMTQPAGSVTYNNYELLLHGVTYGITDRVQASVTVLSPIVRDMPFVGFAAVKGRIVATDRFHLALQGSAGVGHFFGDSADGTLYSVGAGGFASYCLRDDCSSLASASATYQLISASGASSGPVHTIVYGGSIVHRVARNIKLLGEVTSAAGRGETDSSLQNLDGVLAGYGVRFHNANLAADVGFLKPISTGADDGGFLMGLPFASVSYRWQ